MSTFIAVTAIVTNHQGEHHQPGVVNLDLIRSVYADDAGRAVLVWATPNVRPTTITDTFTDTQQRLTERQTTS